MATSIYAPILDSAKKRTLAMGVTGILQSNPIVRNVTLPRENGQWDRTLFFSGKDSKSFETGFFSYHDSAEKANEWEYVRKCAIVNIIGKMGNLPADIILGANLIMEMSKSDVDFDALIKEFPNFRMVRETVRKDKVNESETALNAVPREVLENFAKAALALREALIGVERKSEKAAKEPEPEFDPSATVGKRKNGKPPLIGTTRTPVNPPSATPHGEGAKPAGADMAAAIAKSEAAAKAANEAEKPAPVVATPINNGESKNPIPRPVPAAQQNQGKHNKHGKKGK